MAGRMFTCKVMKTSCTGRQPYCLIPLNINIICRLVRYNVQVDSNIFTIIVYLL